MFEDERRRWAERVKQAPNGWPFDAIQDHPLTARRIAVCSSHPQWYYPVGFDYESEAQPTAHEVEQLVSYLQEYKEHWYGDGEYRQFLDSRPLDVDGGANGVVFHKYGENDWAYRRRTWEGVRFVPLHPNVRAEYGDTENERGTFTLEEVMDRTHGGGTERPRSWREWKAKHPELFWSTSMSDLSFSERARRSIVLAQTIAARRENIYIGAEDLLLGILSEGENVAAIWLRNHGITISDFEDFLREGQERGSTYPS